MTSPDLLRLAELALSGDPPPSYHAACRALAPRDRLRVGELIRRLVHGPGYAARDVERVISWD